MRSSVLQRLLPVVLTAFLCAGFLTSQTASADPMEQLGGAPVDVDVAIAVDRGKVASLGPMTAALREAVESYGTFPATREGVDELKSLLERAAVEGGGFDGPVLFLARRTDDGAPDWALLIETPKGTEKTIRELLKPVPRTTLNGRPIQGLEGGRISLCFARSFDGPEPRLRTLLGSTGGRVFTESLDLLGGEQAAEPLSRSPAFRLLSKRMAAEDGEQFAAASIFRLKEKRGFVVARLAPSSAPDGTDSARIEIVSPAGMLWAPESCCEDYRLWGGRPLPVSDDTLLAVQGVGASTRRLDTDTMIELRRTPILGKALLELLPLAGDRYAMSIRASDGDGEMVAAVELAPSLFGPAEVADEQIGKVIGRFGPRIGMGEPPALGGAFPETVRRAAFQNSSRGYGFAWRFAGRVGPDDEPEWTLLRIGSQENDAQRLAGMEAFLKGGPGTIVSAGHAKPSRMAGLLGPEAGPLGNAAALGLVRTVSWRANAEDGAVRAVIDLTLESR